MKGYVARKGNRWYAVIYEGLDPVTGRERRSWHAAGTPRVELPREERGGRQQDPVGSLELPVLTLELLEPCRTARCGARPTTGVNVGLLHPASQRVGIDPCAVNEGLARQRLSVRIVTPTRSTGTP